ncbi:hypothetical protein GQ53DRAFT_750162 [Thozetella sp. PMI_491]|nr:hypothetical protein GQ53DRAFT_750162 [Thozetella sp. PMI_491]
MWFYSDARQREKREASLERHSWARPLETRPISQPRSGASVPHPRLSRSHGTPPLCAPV